MSAVARRSAAFLVVVGVLAAVGSHPFGAPRRSLARRLVGQFRTAKPVVGQVAGEFQVSPYGTATYQIAIEVPPGTNDVQPALSITYDSHRGNGYLGVGWAINGLSSIARCPPTMAQDGFSAGVTFAATDRFCLDNLRLMAVQGAYGADGTIYHTEKETWTRVVSNGTCGRGPCAFTATTKDGTTLQFGVADAQVLAQGRSDGSVMTWAVKTFVDRNGNTVTTTYTNNGASQGEYYPQRIQYTGNTVTGTTPRRSVVFNYETRPDPQKSYVAGSLLQTSVRLTDITTQVDGNVVQQYVLTYDPQPPPPGWSRLKSLQQCDADGDCLMPTAFTWQDPTFTLQSPNSDPRGLLISATCWGGPGESSSWSDFNGDGKSDYHCDNVDARRTGKDNRGSHWVLASTGTALVSVNGSSDGLVQSNWCTGSKAHVAWADFNGDGLVDLICDEEDGSHSVLVSTGTGVTSPNSSSSGSLVDRWCRGSSPFVSWADFNGDGRMDLHCDDTAERPKGGDHFVLVSNGTGVQSPNSDPAGLLLQSTCWAGPRSERSSWSDFNGDGKADYHCDNWSSKLGLAGYHWVRQSNGVGLSSVNATSDGRIATDWCVGDDARIGWTDFNGDGLVDMTCDQAGSHSVMLSTGTGVVSPNANPKGLLNTNWCTGSGVTSWSDFNGDGLSDLHCWEPTIGKHSALLSTGLGLVSPNTNGGVIKDNWCAAGDDFSWGDFNGDGLADMFCDQTQEYPKGGDHFVQVQTPGFPNLLSSIQTGFGGTIAITYSTLSDNSIYSRGAGATYPLRTVQGSTTIVKSYTLNDGRGHGYSYGYQYQGAVYDVSGRGFLGYAMVSMTEQATGRVTQITYNQAFPFTGSVASSKVLGPAPASVTLSLVNTTYTAIQPYPGVPAYQVVPSVERRSIYSTEGQPAYTLERDFQYDGFGNVAIVSDLGDITTPADRVYSCTRYNNDATNWRLGYIAQQQTTSTLASCASFITAATPSWDPANSLQWSTTTYDASGNMERTAQWDDSTNQWIGRSYTYDAYGNVLTVTNPGGAVITVVYDTVYHSFPTTLSMPPNDRGVTLVTKTVFEPTFGEKTSSTDPNGNTFTYTIDGFGRIAAAYGPSPSGGPVMLRREGWVSDSTGIYAQVQHRDDWSNDAVDTWYWEREYVDGLARNYRSQSRGPTPAQAIVREVTFDDAGRVYQQSLPYFQDAKPFWITTHYDLNNEPVEVTQPDGTKKVATYDLPAKKIATTQAAGTPLAATTVRTFNARGSTTRKVLPNGGAADYEYDKLQRLTNVVDPMHLTSSTRYDSLSRVSSTASADRGTTTYVYGTTGDLQTETDALGTTTTYAYDALGRITSKAEANGDDRSTTTYVYDETAYQNGLGNLTSVSSTSADGPTFHFGYDAYDDVTSNQTIASGVTYAFIQAYDPLGRDTTLTFPDHSQLSSTYTPDSHPATVTVTQGGTATTYASFTSYNSLGDNLVATYGNGVVTTSTYYPLDVATGKLESLVMKSPRGQVLYEDQYTWNRRDVVTDETTTVSGPVSPGAQAFAYDAGKMNYLTDAKGAYGTQSFSYDLVGDVTQQNGVTYQYASGTHQIESDSAGLRLHYLANGMLSAKTAGGVTSQFAYSLSGNLKSVSQENRVVNAFSSNHFGERFRKTASDGTITTYVGDNYEVTQFPDARGTQYTRYINGPDGRLAGITAAGNGIPVGRSGVPSPPDALQRMNPGALVLALSCGVLVLLLAIYGWTAFLAARRGSRGLCRRSRRVASARPLATTIALVTTIAFTNASIAQAALTPGANGAGYPVIGTAYYHQNLVRDTVLVTDTAGNTVTNLAYLPFGLIDQGRSFGPDIVRQKFGSYELDADIGLYYAGARYYDPALGQFIAPDPDYQGFSPYPFVGDDPETDIDPDGEFWFAAVRIVTGAVVGAYFGGAAVNGTLDPSQWDWKDGTTYGGMAIGAAIGMGGAGLGAAAASRGAAAGIAGEVFIGAGESAAFEALGGGSLPDIGEAAAFGALTGGLVGGGAALFGRVGKGLVARGARPATDAAEVGSETGTSRLRLADAGCSSFERGTRVLGQSGPIAIERVRPGDVVWGYNEQTGISQPAKVTHTISRHAAELLDLTIADETIEATPEHPFYHQARGWVKAGELRAGDVVRTARGFETVGDVTWRHGQFSVHNLEIDGLHTYYVSGAAVLSHNVRAKCLKAKGTQRPPWQSTTRPDLEARQTVSTAAGDLIQSAVSNVRLSRTEKILIGKKNPRFIRALSIDHRVPYKYLLIAAKKSKDRITWQDMKRVSNYIDNLRLITFKENVSHRFEIKNKVAGVREAIKIFKKLGFRF